MCGIVGLAARRPQAETGWLLTACDSMRHRGPDDSGEWWSADRQVGLGHRRLAVIDLSASGHQPMLDARRELAVVFNGEIYNFVELRRELQGKGHCFRTGSDTEVVLAAYREWGADCPAKMNGMFALALYDSVRRRVFLARDRAGEKPLFYSIADGMIRFASELKGMLADPAFPRQVDRESLDLYLAMGFVPAHRTMLLGVRKLPPAHALSFDVETGESREWRYWSLPPAPSDAGRTEDDATLLDELEHLLERSVRRQLVADVPVGILLSGGVDSSLVTAMAARAVAQVKTFTVRFSGYTRHDESAHARLIADHFGTDHLEVEAGSVSVEIVPLLAAQFDEPLADSSMIPTYLVSQVIRRHCTVAIGGDGGDELFGGYRYYSRLLWFNKWLHAVPRAIRGGLARLADHSLPVGFPARNWARALAVDTEHALPFIANHFDPSARLRLMQAHSPWRAVAEGLRGQSIPLIQDAVLRATRMDFENYLPEDILVKVDRASMLNSLEVRAPFLDSEVIEFAFGKVPSRLKASESQRKILLRRLCSRILPKGFDNDRKQGFSIPLGEWLRGGRWREFFGDTLLRSDSVFDQSFVRGLFDGQTRGFANEERLFSLVMFELWRRHYGVTML
jgi:asparagine synthase (glutamine-hydrolysing)